MNIEHAPNVSDQLEAENYKDQSYFSNLMLQFQDYPVVRKVDRCHYGAVIKKAFLGLSKAPPSGLFQ